MNYNGKNRLKELVKQHWEKETCGIRYGASPDKKEFYLEIEKNRYYLEPYILEFAGFSNSPGIIGFRNRYRGGVDFSQWVQSGAIVTGIDLTKAAISYTKERLNVLGLGNLGYKLCQGDAESLPFKNMLFDLVYAWGVFHHTPDTLKAFQEAFCVLKTGGTLKAMVYHVPSWTGWMLWFRYGLLKGRPLLSPRVAIFNYLESPGTKTYTIREAKKMLLYCGFKNISVKTKLSVSDLLNIKPSNRYQGLVFKLIWKIYPRWLVRFLGDQLGTPLLTKTRK